MPTPLEHFSLSHMAKLGATLRSLGDRSTCVEEVAQQITQLLYRELTLADGSEPACVLVRYFQTLDFELLDPNLQDFGRKLMAGQPIRPDTKCLTLLGSAGACPEWNDRTLSRGHQAIPLPSVQVVESIPMISQLLTQLGLGLEQVVNPDRSLILEQDVASYNVFLVPQAMGSPYVPAQDSFVAPFGIQSVLGFGGMLPSGQVYAALLFSRVPIRRGVADLFRMAAMNLKVALLPFLEGPFFIPHAPHARV